MSHMGKDVDTKVPCDPPNIAIYFPVKLVYPSVTQLGNYFMPTHKAKPKVYGSHGYCRPVNQHWDACAPLRHLSLVQENPPGEGLVTRRRTVQVSWREVAEPKVPQ